MLAKSVHHISFCVSDLERSRRFYEQVLGLEPIPRPDLGLPGAWYRSGGAEVHLIARVPGVDSGAPPEKLSPLADHQAFRIDDYAEALAALRQRGIEVLEGGADRGQLWLRDPDGHVIELTTGGS